MALKSHKLGHHPADDALRLSIEAKLVLLRLSSSRHTLILGSVFRFCGVVNSGSGNEGVKVEAVANLNQSVVDF
jgi:hypothetical protein